MNDRPTQPDTPKGRQTDNLTVRPTQSDTPMVRLTDSLTERPTQPDTPMVLLTDSLRRQIFEGKLSVSPYFLHHFLDINGAIMILKDKLSLKTLGVFISIIF